jgi:uncharacterized protein YmfQ (DUF2313 family)
MAMLIECWAVEFSRVDSQAMALINEADPRFCSETFEDWITQWGVPDSCLEAWGSLLADGLTETILRQALLQKITTIGSQSLQFFVDLAKTYGYSITIDELFNQTVLSTVLTPFASGTGWASQWRVHVYKNAGATVSRHTAIGTAEEALAWWGDSVIECVIRHYAPAHTNVIFGYFED